MLLQANTVLHNCRDEDHSNAVFSEDGANDIGEDIEHIGHLSKSKTDAERQRRDCNIALTESARTNHLQSRNNDISKHNDGASAKDRLGKARKDRSEYGEHARKYENSRARGNRKSVDDLRHRKKTYVLAEGRDRHTTEASGK